MRNIDKLSATVREAEEAKDEAYDKLITEIEGVEFRVRPADRMFIFEEGGLSADAVPHLIAFLQGLISEEGEESSSPTQPQERPERLAPGQVWSDTIYGVVVIVEDSSGDREDGESDIKAAPLHGGGLVSVHSELEPHGYWKYAGKVPS